MLIAGIVLTILGYRLMIWSFKGLNYEPSLRPFIFNNSLGVIILFLIWIGLISSGFYCLWKVNYIIVLILIIIYLVLILLRLSTNNVKSKVQKICITYKLLKQNHQLSNEQDILKETAINYFRDFRWEQFDINYFLNTYFSEDNKDNKENILDINTLIQNIFVHDKTVDYLNYKKKYKINKVIEDTITKLL